MGIEKDVNTDKFGGETKKVLVNILYTASWIRGRFNKTLKPYQLSEQQFNVLRILRGQYPEPAMLSLIQARMLDKMSNATRLVDKLEKKGLVTRKRNEQNRRQVNILITQKGLNLLEELDTVFEDYIKIYEDFPLEDTRLLSNLLDRLREGTEEKILNGNGSSL